MLKQNVRLWYRGSTVEIYLPSLRLLGERCECVRECSARGSSAVSRCGVECCVHLSIVNKGLLRRPLCVIFTPTFNFTKFSFVHTTYVIEWLTRRFSFIAISEVPRSIPGRVNVAKLTFLYCLRLWVFGVLSLFAISITKVIQLLPLESVQGM